MQPRGSVLFMIGLLTGGLGCATLPGSPLAANGEPTAGSTRPETDLPKRQPKASTYVAFGELHEKAAEDPRRAPADQQELRTKARLAYEQALQIKPNDLPALAALGRLYATMGAYERAVSTYHRAIQAHPKEAALRYELGMCHARQKQWDLALASLQKAVEASPENPVYGHAYGFCLARAQRHSESLAVLERLEGKASAHYNLARMLHHMQQDELSKDHVRLALAANPDLVPAQQLLAELEAPAADPGEPILTTGFASAGASVRQVDDPSKNLVPAPDAPVPQGANTPKSLAPAPDAAGPQTGDTSEGEDLIPFPDNDADG